VNAVALGPVPAELFLQGKTAAQNRPALEVSPLERLGTPNDTADVVSFLAGPDGRWVNAQMLRTNGGSGGAQRRTHRGASRPGRRRPPSARAAPTHADGIG
jgi:NAD(P)-dependent dehydrogenase (short-subunit alcohol dehydrogenase family)